MSIFKCKMCGGTLEINNNETVGVCEYCGTKQTLPRLDDDRKTNLYDRANHFRRNNDYDKAMSIYENILNEDKTDAEAYWSIVLCRYGIEYVEDPSTHKRVPTVNRAQLTSIYADEDYKSALEYADSVQKSIYEEEARAIDDIQKGILAISQKEEPFDVFICYKETDNNGRRTPDSVLANDLYHQLKQEGFKVFFARITLEDKLGTAYEPYIFAALNSSKVMVVLGTKPEYFNAVWVKNEWSRYLALIRNGAKKILIPAYKDMDPYDLPEEFSHLQAQDMPKLGFMQDLIRGIKKIASKDEPAKTVVKETVTVNTSDSVAPLLRRAFMFLEDGDWQSADEYCEKVLDKEPENAQAYLGKLMAELKVKKQNNLKDCAEPFDCMNNYQKAVRFADSELKTELKGYIKFIVERNKNALLERMYNDAKNKMGNAKEKHMFLAAAKIFDSIKNFKDSEQLANECREKGEAAYRQAQYDKAVNLFENAINETNCEYAKNIFEELGDYKDSKKYIDSYDEKIEEIRKDAIYFKAMVTKNTSESDEERKIANLSEAAQLFESVSKWKDAYEQAEICKTEIEKIEKAQQDAKIEQKKIKKKKKIIAISALGAIALLVVFVIILSTVIIPNSKYNQIIEYIEQKNYVQATLMLQELGDYKDAKELTEKYAVDFSNYVSENKYHVVGLKSDGTVLASAKSFEEKETCEEYGMCNVSNWSDIVAVSAGGLHTVGLKSDGTVVATGYNYYGQCDVSSWTDIIAVSAGYSQTVGLKSDGTVVATGDNKNGQCNVSDWTDIVAVSAAVYHTVGLKSDGTVVATGENEFGQCDVSDWTDIVAVSTAVYHTVGLKSDGTFISTDRDLECDSEEWSGTVAISTENNAIYGLKSYGTVVSEGHLHPFKEGKELVAIAPNLGLDKYGNVYFENSIDYMLDSSYTPEVYWDLW